MKMLPFEEHAALDWTKSQSSQAAGYCVEVASSADGVAVRDAASPEDGALVYTRNEFAAFIDGVKRGEFDHLV